MSNSIKLKENVPEGITASYRSALKVVDDIVLKNYITRLNEFDVVPLDRDLIKSNIKDNVLFFKITEMVYEKDEFAPHKFATVFSSAAVTEDTIFVMIDSNGIKTDFYIGVRAVDENRTTSSIRNIVENTLKGQFPGIKTKDCTEEEMNNIISKIKTNSISAVSCVANSKKKDNQDNKGFVQGLEKFVLSLQGQQYTAIIMANTTNQEQLQALRREYEGLYSQLSAFATVQVNYSSNDSYNFSMATTTGNSSSVTHTVSESDTKGTTTTEGTTDTHGESKQSTATKIVNGVATATAMVGAALAPITGGVSLAVGGVVSGGLGLLGNAINKNVSDSKSTSFSTSESVSITKGTSTGNTETVNYGVSETKGLTKGTGEGMTLTFHDKVLENTLERIDKQLKRIDEFESLGMYECCAYFMSENQYSAEVAASTYKALMQGENTGVEVSAINSWGNGEKEKNALISEYLKNFIHPVFKYNGSLGEIDVTPCSLVSGNELALHMGLPRSSVCGFPVIEHADFAKEVVSYTSEKDKDSFSLGKIFNMGQENDKTAVKLKLNSLTKHTFITGSTGSGKSNTIYKMIHKIGYLYGLPYLVIEPAKGEYGKVFGNMPYTYVYGTNPSVTPLLLKINPFSIADGIHILEHLDGLIEIFNACWPMYAAMPAVLKKAIERSYEDCGWDLADSSNPFGKNLYPTFSDVVRNIRTIIDSSDYDTENKGAYKGSLITRLESLTNGINGTIFTSDELSNEDLFDNKVIVDLSRVRSAETKSLIMGMLILKLQEYRMSSRKMNSDLSHLTVLEEAHNILKRTSSEQSTESANLIGKSVEMIANSIAEMRTYGEGFIIADQAPSLLDMSVIRNTNTKVIMHLPDATDRELVGRSANLNDDQIGEIAKLPCGVAAVYQDDWIEPVLCKIEKYEHKEQEASSASIENTERVTTGINSSDNYIGERIKLAEMLCNTETVTNTENAVSLMDKIKLSAYVHVQMVNYLMDPPSSRKMTLLAPLMSALFPKVRQAVKVSYTKEKREPAQWTRAAVKSLDENYSNEFDLMTRKIIIQAIMTDYIYLELDKEMMLKEWKEKGVKSIL